MKSFIMILACVSTMNFWAAGLEYNTLSTVNLTVACVTIGLAIGLAVSTAGIAVVELVCETERTMHRK